MNVHIDDSEFIDLINAVTADEIAALESSVEDLESELSDKADEEYVDDLAVDLRNEWQLEIQTAIDNCPASTDYEDEINDIQRELISNAEGCGVMSRNVNTLQQQVAELELGHADLSSEIRDLRRLIGFLDDKINQPGIIRRSYNRLLAMSSRVNWYSPKL